MQMNLKTHYVVCLATEQHVVLASAPCPCNNCKTKLLHELLLFKLLMGGLLQGFKVPPAVQVAFATMLPCLICISGIPVYYTILEQCHDRDFALCADFNSSVLV
jgi:hypothetical protein